MRAPQFTLKDTEGNDITLPPEHGIIVLYFYPKANTPGCTTEGVTFSKRYPEFIDAGALVVGVSPDPLEKVCAFSEKHTFAHTLLADPDHAVAEAYGVWKPKSFMGKTFLGVQRKTFLIVDGTIVQEWEHKPGKTEQEILHAVQQL